MTAPLLTWSIRQYDTGPPVPCQLVSENARQAVDLTGATVVAHMVAAETGVAVFTGAACTVTSAVDGLFELSWPANSTDANGTFLLSFEITLAGGTKESYPDDGYVYVSVRADLNGS